MDMENSSKMSDNNDQRSDPQSCEIDGSNSINDPNSITEADPEVRDIGTPLDDEPDINDSIDHISNKIDLPQDPRIQGNTANNVLDAIVDGSQENIALESNSNEESSWQEQTSRPHSSSAATPTQDDNINAEDISGIPVPTTGPQFLNFTQPSSTQAISVSETSELIGSIPLPQVTDDGSDAEIAIVDAISNVNVISGSIKSHEKRSDTRIEREEVTEKDEFGRDMPRRKKINKEVVTIEEVSDDDLPEVVEEHRFGNREEIVSDADSNYSMVSNNSLSGENCHTSEKDQKSRKEGDGRATQDANERDEISSLSGLSSEDEMKENDRLQLMTGQDEIRDLEDGEISRGKRLRDGSKNSLALNGHDVLSPSRNSLYGRSGSAGGRDSALSGRQSQSEYYSSKRRNKRNFSKYDDLERDSDEDNSKLPHVMERQVIERDESPNAQEEFNRRMGSSPNMYSFGRKEAGKRSDLPRYDVRNVIERKKKVKGSKNKRGRSDSRDSRSPYSKSPRNRSSGRSRSISPRGGSRNVSKPRKKKRNKKGNRGRSRSDSRSLSPRSYRSYSRSRSRSRSPASHKRRKNKKLGRKGKPRSPSPRGRRVSPIRRRGRRSVSRSPSFDDAPRGFSGSRARGRYSRSPVRGAVDISPSPKRKNGSFSSPRKSKKKSENYSGSTKKVSKSNKKKQKSFQDDSLPNSPTEIQNSAKKSKSAKKINKTEKSKKGEKGIGTKQSKKKRRDNSSLNEISVLNTHSSSVVEKEVYAAGDKIMVSVNFKSKANNTKIPVDKPPKVGGEAKSENKPTVVIDCLASPYEVIEPSPKEIIDIYSDEDEFSNQGLDSKQSINKKKKQKQQKALQQSNSNTSGGSEAVRVENVSSTVMPRTPSPLRNDARSTVPDDDLVNNVTSTQSMNMSNMLISTQQNPLQLSQQTSQINSNSDHINLSGNLSMGMSEFTVDKVSSNIDQCSNGVERELPSSSMSGQALIQQIQTLSHKGPCTPPPLTTVESENFDLMRGPQTPNDEPLDSYDPCNPTESPDIGDDFVNNSKTTMPNASGSSISNAGHATLNGDRNHMAATNTWKNSNIETNKSINPFDMMRGDINQNGDYLNSRNNSMTSSSAGNHISQKHKERDPMIKNASGSIPFLMEERDTGVSSTKDKENHDRQDKDQIDFSVDMDMDSPFSPQSSEMSDIFEPPLDTPLTNRKMSNAMKRGHKNISSSAGKQSKGGSKPSKNKHNIHMKVVDDKLRIIDDVPSSAVELSVKEKFLKKVQRQERIVEEIKLVLKPYYNRKKINKDDYKDILRKCVPKVCHSKNGDINPLKIQKLVKGYVKKVSYIQKRQTI